MCVLFSGFQGRPNQFAVAREHPFALVNAGEGWMSWKDLRCFDERLNHSPVSDAVPPVSVGQATHDTVPRVFVPHHAVGIAPRSDPLVPVPRPLETRFLVAVQARDRKTGMKLVENLRWPAGSSLQPLPVRLAIASGAMMMAILAVVGWVLAARLRKLRRATVTQRTKVIILPASAEADDEF